MKLYLTSEAATTLDKIVIDLGKDPHTLKVAFVPTAADLSENKPWIDKDRTKLIELGFNVFELSLKNKSESEIRSALEGVDIIFVAGGNTFYLLEKANISGFSKIVKEMVQSGIIYIGSSAGSVIAGPNIEAVAIFDDPFEANLDSTAGFGFVDFIVLPHFKKPKYGFYHDKVIKDFGEKYKIVPITDEQFIIVNDSEYKIV